MDDRQKEEILSQLRPIALHFALWPQNWDTDPDDLFQEIASRLFQKSDAFLETILVGQGARLFFSPGLWPATSDGPG